MKKENINFKRLMTFAIVASMCLVVVPTASADIPTEMVAYWKLDEGIGSIASDETANANDGTLSGGKFGNALEFSVSQAHVYCGDAASLKINHGTWEAWLNFAAKPSETHMMNPLAKTNQYWIHASDGTDDPYGPGIITNVDSIQVKITIGGTRYIATTGPNFIQTGVWYHVAGTYDGTSLKLYINGVLIDSITIFGSIDAGSYQFTIGTWSTLVDDFHGIIDEVRVSNVARPSFDLTQAPQVDVQTVGLWHLDESIGLVAHDETIYGNDGTISGATWAGPTWTTGKIGNALKFDGVDDYVEVPDDDTLDISAAWTISAWLYWEDGDETYETIFCKEAPGLHPAYAAWAYSGNLYAGMTLMPGASYDDWVQDTTMGTIAKDAWTHVSLTFDGADLRSYIDGVYTDILYVGEVGYTNDNSLFFGRREGIRQEFKGLIDEVAIYNTALSAVDIAKLYCISNTFGFGYCDPPSLTYTGNLLFGDTDDLIIEATFKDSEGTGMSGYNVEFFFNGSSVGTNTTGSDGVAILNIYTKAVNVYEVYAEVYCSQSDPALLAVYDPTEGFVTGGGWIDSPAGAYVANPSAEGKANFGFVSKYKKGQSIPTGNTEFQFKAGDLNFHSSDYDWLVITGGNKAMYKGTGTINDDGSYKFMITAYDDNSDTFRIKIWEEDEFGVETIIYDNGANTPLGGGQIKIHQN